MMIVKRLNIGTLGMDILLHTIALYFRPPFRAIFDTSLGGLSLQQASSTACPLLNLRLYRHCEFLQGRALIM